MTVERNLLRVVEYHANPARQLIGAAWMFCVGLIFLLIGREEPRFAYVFGWPLLAAAACFAVYFVWRIGARGLLPGIFSRWVASPGGIGLGMVLPPDGRPGRHRHSPSMVPA
jgi:hypothetical protein